MLFDILKQNLLVISLSSLFYVQEISDNMMVFCCSGCGPVAEEQPLCSLVDG